MGLGTGTVAAPVLDQDISEAERARELKIAALREQYRNGTYQVDSAALTAKLIESLLK